MRDIRAVIGKRIIFSDGAMGTALQAAGLEAGTAPEDWNITHPEVLVGIHSAYINAGSDIITANTFGANRYKLESEYSVEQVVAAAMKNVKTAIDRSGRECFAALNVGPTGRLLAPMGDLPFDDAYCAFREMIEAGVKNGADLIYIETMTDMYEMKAAVLAAKECCDLPVFATFSFDENGRLLTGGDAACAVSLLEGLGVDALGINCGQGPENMRPVVEQLLACASVPVIITPNAGLPVVRDGVTGYDIDARGFARSMRSFAEAGALILGGCCGTTAEHIAETVRSCSEVSPVPVRDKGITVVSSFAKACEIGYAPVIIGERINPTGKKLLKQALIEENYEYLVAQGVAQEADGAHILDVNTGLPGIDECEAMLKTVSLLQSSTTLPLQIDTASAQVMERALRYYNGKALVNSVSGKESVMRSIFPLVKKYGGVVVALTLDDDGIPETAEGRLAIARRIVETAAEYGIDRKNIIVDALTMTVSANALAPKITLDALSMIKKELGVKTILGVSNVSFALPQREKINSTFFALALRAGLDAAIINPSSAAMMDTYYSYSALNGFDEDCAGYIARFSDTPAQPQQIKTDKRDELVSAVIDGLEERAYEIAAQRLKNTEPQTVINSYLVPALDEVGRSFEESRIFLPQLLKSAKAAQSAFAAVNEVLSAGGKQDTKGQIIIATVKGDVHDIGKNIVKVMLENYGYEVIDLGKDVPCEKIADEAQRLGVKLVGLSALMTTTVPSMEETIKLIRSRGLDCKVMVGGAVLTAEYAKQIGADFYAADAMESVGIAEKVFAE